MKSVETEAAYEDPWRVVAVEEAYHEDGSACTFKPGRTSTSFGGVTTKCSEWHLEGLPSMLGLSCVEVSRDGTRRIYHRLGEESWTHAETDESECGQCSARVRGSGAVPIPPGVNKSLNPVGGDAVHVLFDPKYGGFLGYEVAWKDKRITPSLYSTVETLPKRFRQRVLKRGKYCSEPGCSNVVERGLVCQTHRKARRAPEARSAAGQTPQLTHVSGEVG